MLGVDHYLGIDAITDVLTFKPKSPVHLECVFDVLQCRSVISGPITVPSS